MIHIPLIGASILSRTEKVALAKACIKGAYAEAALNVTADQVERTTTLGNALAEALNICVDALKNGTDPQVACDQAQAVLTAAYEKAYPGEEFRGF